MVESNTTGWGSVRSFSGVGYDHPKTIRDFVAGREGRSFDFGIFSMNDFTPRGRRGGLAKSFTGGAHAETFTRMDDEGSNERSERTYWKVTMNCR